MANAHLGCLHGDNQCDDKNAELRVCKGLSSAVEYQRYVTTMFANELVDRFEDRKKTIDQNMKRYPDLYQHDATIIIPLYRSDDEYSKYVYCERSVCLITIHKPSIEGLTVFETRELIESMKRNRYSLISELLYARGCKLWIIDMDDIDVIGLYATLDNSLYTTKSDEISRARKFILRSLFEYLESWRNDMIEADIETTDISINFNKMQECVLVNDSWCMFAPMNRLSQCNEFKSRDLLLDVDTSDEFIRLMTPQGITIEIFNNPQMNLIRATWDQSKDITEIHDDQTEDIEFNIVK